MYELMHSDGRLESVAVRGPPLVACGQSFVHYATFGDVVAYCVSTFDSHQPMSDPIRVRLPNPLGKLLYPAPILWSSPQGLAHYWPTATSVARVKLQDPGEDMSSDSSSCGDVEDVTL